MTSRHAAILAFQRAARPLFPITSFVPGSRCPHNGPIRPGSVFECMCCSRGGRDRHPMLAKCVIVDESEESGEPKADPKAPETAASAEKAGRDAQKPTTRRQRRLLKFAADQIKQVNAQTKGTPR